MKLSIAGNPALAVKPEFGDQENRENVINVMHPAILEGKDNRDTNKMANIGEWDTNMMAKLLETGESRARDTNMMANIAKLEQEKAEKDAQLAEKDAQLAILKKRGEAQERELQKL